MPSVRRNAIAGSPSRPRPSSSSSDRGRASNDEPNASGAAIASAIATSNSSGADGRSMPAPLYGRVEAGERRARRRPPDLWLADLAEEGVLAATTRRGREARLQAHVRPVRDDARRPRNDRDVAVVAEERRGVRE